MRNLYRPEPLIEPRVKGIDRDTSPGALDRLITGESLLITDHYGTGATLLKQVEERIPIPGRDAPFAARQAAFHERRKVSLRLLAPIVDHALALEHAEPIGFLAELYPELQRFVLPLLHVQELHHAWKLYETGVHVPVLGHKLHPFFSTYMPKRMEHLELFGTWLRDYDGPKEHAVDLGAGCGVLSYQLARAGFNEVIATDVNPNALESIRRELKRHPAPIQTLDSDLFAGVPESPLVVCNPPWLPGPVGDPFSAAHHFEPGFFERFFEQASQREGRLVILFSTVMTLVQSELPHPVQTELERGRFNLVQRLQRKAKPSLGPDGKRRRTKERLELWVLERRTSAGGSG